MRITGSSNVSINGQVFSGDVYIRNNKVFVDGQEVDGTTLQGPINVVVNGSVNSLDSVSGDVVINGDVTGSVKTVSGDITCHTVMGNAKTVSGDITGIK